MGGEGAPGSSRYQRSFPSQLVSRGRLVRSHHQSARLSSEKARQSTGMCATQQGGNPVNEEKKPSGEVKEEVLTTASLAGVTSCPNSQIAAASGFTPLGG